MLFVNDPCTIIIVIVTCVLLAASLLFYSLFSLFIMDIVVHVFISLIFSMDGLN